MSFGNGSNISPMMNKLNKEATERARVEIARKFAEQHDLEDIPAYSVHLQKQLQSATAQLDGAVQGKLDALKRAVDLMDESAVKLSNFMLNMSRVDQRIGQTNSSIASFENLKRVHNIRDNLNRVISQIDYFGNVPNKERVLREMLEADSSKLKDVFLESLKLNSLRIALLTEIKDNETSLRSFIETTLHLEVVPKLAEFVAEVALSNISGFLDATGRERDFYDLALDSPADLVATFEVIQMHQEYYDRRKAQFRRKAPGSNKGTEVDQLAIFEVYKLREQAVARLKQRISFRIEMCFEAFATDYAAAKRSRTMAVLDAGSELIKLFVDIINDVDPCIPKEYDTINTYFYLFDFHLEPKIHELVSGIGKISVGEIINIVDWLKYYNTQMERFGLVNEENDSCVIVMDRYEKIAADLMKEYLSRIKVQVMKWFDNIRKQELEIVEAGDRTLITSNPEDMFNVIHAQMAVAKENLPPECLKDVVVACLDVLQDVQNQSKAALAKNWRSVTPETLCSTVNDNQRMQEKTIEFADSIEGLIPVEEDRVLLQSKLTEVADEYVTIAITAVSYLARIVLDDLEEAVFQQLFIPQWESGEKIVAVAIATMKDYLADFAKWLSEFFYCKLVYELMVKFTAAYVMSLRRFPPGSFKFNLEFRAAKTIIDDEELLIGFFEEYLDEIIRGGAGKSIISTASTGASSKVAVSTAASPVRDELDALRALSMIVSASHISSIEVEVRAMYAKWGIDGQKLVQSAINSNPALSKTDRTDMLDAASSMFAQKAGGSGYSTAPSEEFKNVADAHLDVATVVKAVKQKTRMFWG